MMNRLTGRRRILFVPMFLAAFVGFGVITMVLWNALLPMIFHLPLISFWQAIGLLVLSRLLFGFNGPWGGRHHHHGEHLREKWENMNPQEREEFRNRLRERHPYWTDRCDNRADHLDSEHKNS